MRYFFTSDYHLGHANIIKYCNRPFKFLKAMNKAIIRNHNARVKKDDIVFHIGDFCFRSKSKKGNGIKIRGREWERKLNCKIIFIRGSHDKNNTCKTDIESLVIKLGGYRINLVHNPCFVNVNYEINLVGHVHKKWKFKRIRRGFGFTDAINVGIDVWSYYPVTIEEILREYAKWKKSEGLN